MKRSNENAQEDHGDGEENIDLIARKINEDDLEDVEFMDEEVVEEDENADDMAIDAEDAPLHVYLPNQQIPEGDVLDYDRKSYEMMHTLNTEWPCLSFDFVVDDGPSDRRKFPHNGMLVAGTQAASAKQNKIYVLSATKLCKTKYDDAADSGEESDDENIDDCDPQMAYREIAHADGAVNRIRALRLTSAGKASTQLCAAFSESGCVRVWDVTADVRSLSDEAQAATEKASSKPQPIFEMRSHKVEGYALAWSAIGRLLSGDCHGAIYLSSVEGGDAGCTPFTEPTPFTGHRGSVEDLQWSPAERAVFASCGVDSHVRIWDTRAHNRSQAALAFAAHSGTDVNVLAWNGSVQYLLATGADDGRFSTWDMRFLATKAGTAAPLATFDWHSRGAVTSIEWHPTESSVLAVCGSDDQTTLWDLSLEADDALENGAPSAGLFANDAELASVPPQLLFVHMGQQQPKEVHWHPQIPGVLGTTAANGFNIFKTINV